MKKSLAVSFYHGYLADGPGAYLVRPEENSFKE